MSAYATTIPRDPLYRITFRGVYCRELRSIEVTGYSVDNATLRARAAESWFNHGNAEFVCASEVRR